MENTAPDNLARTKEFYGSFLDLVTLYHQELS